MTDDLNIKLGITQETLAPGYCGGRVLGVGTAHTINFNTRLGRGLYISPSHAISKQMDKIRERDNFVKYSIYTGYGGATVSFYLSSSILGTDSLYEEFDKFTKDETDYANNFFLQNVTTYPVSSANLVCIGGLGGFGGTSYTPDHLPAGNRIHSPVVFDGTTAYMFFARSPAGHSRGVNGHDISGAQSALKYMYYLYKNSEPLRVEGFMPPLYKQSGPTAVRVVIVTEEIRKRLGVYDRAHAMSTNPTKLYMSALPTFKNHTYPDNHKACAMLISNRPIVFHQ